MLFFNIPSFADECLKLASYNILANSYILPERYPNTDSKLLDWSYRKEKILEKIYNLSADIICLQEVEREAFDFFYDRLKILGYYGIYSQKGFGKPDGCATFFQSRKIKFRGSNTIYFDDKLTINNSRPASGHIALILYLECDGHNFAIANTHIIWNPANIPILEKTCYNQVDELLKFYKKDNQKDWIICGDFNFTADNDVFGVILSHGLKDAYNNMEYNTYNANKRALRVDYIFHDPQLALTPLPIKVIDDNKILPCEDEPSDHLPIIADIHFSN